MMNFDDVIEENIKTTQWKLARNSWPSMKNLIVGISGQGKNKFNI